ncbi:MAG: hypothetical protein Q9167_004496 [Letrouitia subvulpina]
MPGSSKRLRKRLLVNLDGTGQSEYTNKAAIIDDNQTSVSVSNVARIGRAALLEDEENSFEQVVYYQAGVGGEAGLSWTQKAGENLLGKGLVSNVREAYGFICNNYDYGDEIYITGFSRGAFTARSVAGLIGQVGILTKKGLDHFYEAFATELLGYMTLTQRKELKSAQLACGILLVSGGLKGDYSFHDVGLGEHIENAYHLLSLDERRGPFAPTLWESPDNSRSLGTFEQCWMAGDHSNVGGSWDDQQLADIALAWMMSRFRELGVKFDPHYLYREYTKFKEYVETKGPKLQGNDGPPYPDDKKLNPRQWGEGRVKDKYGLVYILHEGIRRPLTYCQPEFVPDGYVYSAYIRESKNLLRNTNETFHPVVRYRHFSDNSAKLGKLGADDQGPYNPKAMNDWKWPSAQKDGRIGAASAGKSDPKSFEYSRRIQNKTVTVQESPMGWYEMLVLAMYDQDPALRRRDGSIWTKVLGGNR